MPLLIHGSNDRNGTSYVSRLRLNFTQEVSVPSFDPLVSIMYYCTYNNDGHVDSFVVSKKGDINNVCAIISRQ